MRTTLLDRIMTKAGAIVHITPLDCNLSLSNIVGQLQIAEKEYEQRDSTAHGPISKKIPEIVQNGQKIGAPAAGLEYRFLSAIKTQ